MYRFTKRNNLAKRIALLFAAYTSDIRRDAAIARLRHDQATVADINVLEDALLRIERHSGNAERSNQARCLITAIKGM